MAGSNSDGLEAEAERLYKIAGLCPADGVAPGRLVRALLGPHSLRFVKREWLRGGGTLARVNREWRVYLRAGLPPEKARFIALHELAHWAMPGASEAECDALAARLLAPRAAFERALVALVTPRRSPTRVYADLGAWFRCTHSFGALRLGEVTGEPLVLVSPESVRVRGAWSGPTEPRAMRALAASPLPGLARARLRDDHRRIVLFAAE